MSFDADTYILLTYIIFNVAVGLYWGRNVKNIKDYALGGRNFSTGTLVATIMASWLGGDYLFITLAEVYTTGLHYAIGCLGMAFGLFLIAYFFVPRMGEFLGNVSVAEAMGNLYGNNVRMIAAVTGGIAAAGFIALQFKVFADLFKHYVGISNEYTIFIAGFIVVIYSALGGIRSVALTDVIQFFTFGVLIPVLSVILWNEYALNNHTTFLLHASNKIFDYKDFIGLENPKFWQLIFLFMLFAIPGFDPTLFQRISIGRSIKQVQQAFTIASFLLLVILMGMSWIAFLLFNVDQNLAPENLVHFIINNYAHTGLKGFILIGIVAMCMSNADSNINSASIVLTHDLFIPLGVDPKYELILLKIFAVLLGCVAIFLASLDYDLLSLVFMTQSFHIPVTALPLIMAILGFRSTTKSVLIGMASGFITVVVWRILFMDITGIDSIVPGIFGNLIFFIGSHYIFKQDGGWVGVKDKVYLQQAKLSRKRKWEQFNEKRRNFSIINFCKSNAPKDELTYSIFGIFALISTICTMYSTSHITIINKNILLFFYESMLILSVSFITYPIWPLSLKHNTPVQFIWILSIFYILVICSTFFVIISNFSQIQTMISIVSLIVVATLLRWRAALFIILSGVLITIELYSKFIAIDMPDLNNVSMEIKVAYLLILVSSMLIMFFKPNQEKYDALSAKNQHLKDQINAQKEELSGLINLKSEFIRNLNHELHTPLTGITSMAQAILGNSKNMRKNEILEEIKIIAQSSDRFNTYTDSILNLAKLSTPNFNLNITNVNLSELLLSRMESCMSMYSDGKNLEFITEIEHNLFIECDKYYMQIIFDNLIINSIQFSEKGNITIKLRREGTIIFFSIEDEGIGIPKEELHNIFEPFEISSRTKSSTGGRGVGLALVKKALEAHNGNIWAESKKEKGSIFRFEIEIQ